jgi:Pyruvate/2-oxoacid:ferredoxin oxidoreductase gamma subunit
MTTNELLIGMAGAGGDGVISAGDALITAAALTGYRRSLYRRRHPRRRDRAELG